MVVIGFMVVGLGFAGTNMVVMYGMGGHVQYL